MTTNIKEVAEIDLNDYVVTRDGKSRSWYYAVKEEWLAESRQDAKRYGSHETAFILMMLALFFEAITLIIALCNNAFWHTASLVIQGISLSAAVTSALWLLRLRRIERERVAGISATHRDWHVRLIALLRRIEGFNSRLSAFKLYSENAEPGQEVDPAVVEKYVLERQELAAIKRKLLRDHATVEFERACTDDGSGFRETRDLSDAVFMNRVRLNVDEATSADETTESPLDERFRELETEEDGGAAKA